MVNSLLIGKTIYNCMNTNEDLNKIVKNKIYPLVADQSTTFPFVVYYRTNIMSSNYTKDGYGEDEVEFTVIGVSDKYNVSCDIANEIRKVFEKKKIDGENLTITNCRLVGVDESWEENAYVQRLNFLCTVN